MMRGGFTSSKFASWIKAYPLAIALVRWGKFFP
jgi:hypothetical protein